MDGPGMHHEHARKNACQHAPACAHTTRHTRQAVDGHVGVLEGDRHQAVLGVQHRRRGHHRLRAAPLRTHRGGGPSLPSGTTGGYLTPQELCRQEMQKMPHRKAHRS